MSQSVMRLLQGAVDAGELSQRSVEVLANFGMLNRIEAGLGLPFEQVDATEGVLVALLVDDSGSIRFGGNTDAVRQGHNDVLDALGGSKQKLGILVSTSLLNGRPLSPYTPLDTAVRMGTHNYDPRGETPLYAKALELLGGVAAKLQDAANNGMNCRAVVLIASDGADNASNRVRASDVARLANELLRGEKCVILAMGFADGATDFRQVFASMGVPDNCILTVGNTPSEIRRAFAVASQSAVRASQSAAHHSQIVIGGFAATP